MGNSSSNIDKRVLLLSKRLKNIIDPTKHKPNPNERCVAVDCAVNIPFKKKDEPYLSHVNPTIYNIDDLRIILNKNSIISGVLMRVCAFLNVIATESNPAKIIEQFGKNIGYNESAVELFNDKLTQNIDMRLDLNINANFKVPPSGLSQYNETNRMAILYNLDDQKQIAYVKCRSFIDINSSDLTVTPLNEERNEIQIVYVSKFFYILHHFKKFLNEFFPKQLEKTGGTTDKNEAENRIENEFSHYILLIATLVIILAIIYIIYTIYTWVIQSTRKTGRMQKV